MIGRGRIIHAVDLFCGGGGTTTGMLAAARGLGLRLDLVAVNHWPRAIETHLANHPWARHICASLTSIDPPADGQKTIFQCVDAIRPEEATGGRKLDLLVASPECTDHSNAKGGKPRNDQSRATAWCILRWADTVRPSHVLVENVPEFVNWGPLGARAQPLKSCRGDLFKTFLSALDALGYRVDWRILNAADYGDATTRRRFFLQAVRGRRRLTWPDPSHAPADKAQALGLEPWRPARDVIDWRLEGRSIFRRKRPLAPNTLRRIAKGIEKYWGEWARPFLVMLYGTNDARSIERPVPTVTGAGQHIGLAEPFVMPISHGGARTPRGVGDPLPTLTGAREQYLAEPLIVHCGGPEGDVRTVEQPLRTILGREHQALAEPFLVRYQGGPDGERRVHSIENPLPVQDTSNRYALAEPFVMPISHGGARTPRGVGDPLPTLTGVREQYLAEPFLIATGQTGSHGPRVRSASEPLATLVSKQEQCLVEPFIVPQCGGGVPRGVRKPLPTITTTSRGVGLAEPFLVPQFGERQGQDPRTHPVGEPLPAVTSHGAGAVVEPFLAKYYGTGGAAPVGEPLDTVTSRDRFGLVEPGLVRDEAGNLYALDIRFRMLQPHELAAAMSFPAGYAFAGTKSEQVKQIGNAVAVRTATALCREALGA